MEKLVVNRFEELLVRKARKENRKISRAQAAREIGIEPNIVNSWANNEVINYNRYTLQKLCNYLNCKPGDLIVMEEIAVDDTEGQEITLPASA